MALLARPTIRLVAPLVGADDTTNKWTSIEVSASSTTAAGSMSAADKTKLDGLTAGAAVASVSGTAPIVSSGGTTPAISINPAEGGSAGSMSAADYTKLAGIGTGATVASIGAGTSTTVGGTAAIPVVNVTAASGAAAGSMSAAHYSKVEALPTNPLSTIIGQASITGATSGSTRVIACGNLTGASTITQVTIIPEDALTEDVTNYKILKFYPMTAVGVLGAQIGDTITTQPVASSAPGTTCTGSWTAGVDVGSVTLAYSLAAGSKLLAVWTWANAGVVVPDLVFRIT